MRLIVCLLSNFCMARPGTRGGARAGRVREHGSPLPGVAAKEDAALGRARRKLGSGRDQPGGRTRLMGRRRAVTTDDGDDGASIGFGHESVRNLVAGDFLPAVGRTDKAEAAHGKE